MGETANHPNDPSRRTFLFGQRNSLPQQESDPHGHPFSVEVIQANERVPDHHILFVDEATLPVLDRIHEKPDPLKVQNVAYQPRIPGSRRAGPYDSTLIEPSFPVDVGKQVNDADAWRILSEWYGVPAAATVNGLSFLRLADSEKFHRFRRALITVGALSTLAGAGGFLQTVALSADASAHTDRLRARYSTQSKIASIRNMIIMYDVWGGTRKKIRLQSGRCSFTFASGWS